MLSNRLELKLFSIFPIELFVEIAKYLSPSELASLVMSCWANMLIAKSLDERDNSLDSKYRDNINPFFNSRIHVMQKNLYQAGMCILQGKMKEALAIIDRDMGLLLQVLPSITLQKNNLPHKETHVGRTLYQLALGTYQKNLYEGIGNRIEKKFGLAVKVQQVNEQFPQGVKRKSYRAAFDSLLETIAADLTIDFVNGKNIMNEATRNALKALEISLEAELKECTTGVHFDLQIVIDFIDAAEEGERSKFKFKNDDKSWKQRAFYWRCGFGKLEKFMPYFIAMAINEVNDFIDVMEGRKAATRSTLLIDGSDFFDKTLGDSHWAINGDKLKSCLVPSIAFIVPDPEHIKGFCQRAQKYLSDLRRDCRNQQTLTSTKVNHHRGSGR